MRRTQSTIQDRLGLLQVLTLTCMFVGILEFGSRTAASQGFEVHEIPQVACRMWATSACVAGKSLHSRSMSSHTQHCCF